VRSTPPTPRRWNAPLDGDTRRAYDSRARTFLAWLEDSGLDGDLLTDAHDRDFAVRDYKTHMKTVLGRAANTVSAYARAFADKPRARRLTLR
jgi:integrase/recombinase XerC